MKPSPLRHPVAILRTTLGMYQQQFADEIAHCSRVYLQKIEQTEEYGGKRLTEDLGKRIAHETGVSLEWLLTGDPSIPPKTISGAEFTRDTFHAHRARKTPRNKVVDELMLPTYAMMWHARIRAIAERAHRSADLQLFRYKLDNAINALAAEFGQSTEIARMEPRELVVADVKASDRNGPILLKFARHLIGVFRRSSRRRSAQA